MTAQLSLFCGHRYRRRICILMPHEYGCHFDGVWHWTVGMKWPNWRGGRR